MGGGPVRHSSRHSRSTRVRRPCPWTREALLEVGGSRQGADRVREHPRIRVIAGHPHKGQAQNHEYRMKTQAPLVVGYSEPPSGEGQPYHQLPRERCGD
jgi:hypothetical protein